MSLAAMSGIAAHYWMDERYTVGVRDRFPEASVVSYGFFALNGTISNREDQV